MQTWVFGEDKGWLKLTLSSSTVYDDKLIVFNIQPQGRRVPLMGRPMIVARFNNHTFSLSHISLIF